MTKEESIRAALRFLWQEFGVDIPSEDQSMCFLTLYGILNQGVEDAVRREVSHRRYLALIHNVSQN